MASQGSRLVTYSWFGPVELFGRNIAGRFGKALDPFLDVSKRLQAGFNGVGRHVPQHVRCNGVAQTVEIVDKLPAARGKEQPVGASIPGVVPPLEKSVLDQTIEQAYQGDRLQFQHVGQVDLRSYFLPPQAETS